MTGIEERFSVRRVKLMTLSLVVLGALAELAIRGSISSALSLTGAGVVAIINFHWLEQLLGGLLQPGKPRISGPVVARIILKTGLLMGFFVALLMVPRVDPVAVALGFTTLVAALLVEGVRWGLKGGDEA